MFAIQAMRLEGNPQNRAVFVNKFLRRKVKIRWPNTINNEEL